MTDLPKFEGRPLIKVPETIPTANFLQGEFGEAVHNAVVEKYSADEPFVTKGIKYNQNTRFVEGSKPGYVVAVQGVLPEGMRVATPADLEKVLKIGALELRGQNEDSALVLRSEDSLNAYLAKDLAKQIREKQDLKFPVMIPLNGLALREDSKSDYAFDLKDGAEVIYSKILNKNTNQFSSENIDEKTGLPTKLGSGDRTLYTRDSGLSRFCLCRDLCLDSYDGLLSYSVSYGRVVVVSSGAAAQDFLDEIEREYQTQRTALEARKEKVIAVLKER